MKNLISIFAVLLSVNSMAAEIKNCKLEGKTLSNIVVPNATAVKSIQSVIESHITEAKQREQIKSLLYIEGSSIGDGKGLCELARKTYKVNNECEEVLASNVLIDLILEDSSDINDLTLGCKVGINAKILMEFKM